MKTLYVNTNSYAAYRNNYKDPQRRKGIDSATQQQVAELIHMHRSNYSKVEKGERDLSLDSVNKIAQYFGMTIDQLVHFDGNMPDEVTVEDKSLMEQVKLIALLEEEEEKSMVFKMIDTFLTKKKFRVFVQENMAK